MAIIKKNGNYMSLPKGYKRGNPIPLDVSSVWYSYEEMVNYAKNNATAYVGQILSLVDETNQTAKFYGILNTKGELKEIGSDLGNTTKILADEVSVVIDDNKFALKNYGKRYYHYTNGKYVLQEVNAENPWKAGLEPRVSLKNGELELGWYEPNPITLEEIKTQISNLNTQIKNNMDNISNLQAKDEDIVSILNNYTEKKLYEAKMVEIQNSLNTLEGRTSWHNL